MDNQSGPTCKNERASGIANGDDREDRSIDPTTPPPADAAFADDVLEGAAAIAGFMFGDPQKKRKVYHLKNTSRIPFFYIGSRLCLRKSTLFALVQEQERRNFGTGKPAPDWMNELTLKGGLNASQKPGCDT